MPSYLYKSKLVDQPVVVLNTAFVNGDEMNCQPSSLFSLFHDSVFLRDILNVAVISLFWNNSAPSFMTRVPFLVILPVTVSLAFSLRVRVLPLAISILVRVIASLISTSAAIITTIPNGAELTIKEEVNGWYKVTYASAIGWVSKDYVVLNP